MLYQAVLEFQGSSSLLPATFVAIKKPPLGGFLLVPWKWWSCTKWDCFVFPNLINILWVLLTPSTHKTTHKNFKVSFDVLLQMLKVILAEERFRGEVLQITSFS